MSRTLLQLYIDCVYHNVSTLRWLSWHFVCCMVSRHYAWTTLFVSPTCLVVADFACHHHINCLFHHSGLQPSVYAHFLSLHRSFGTRCHLTSNPRLCPSSVNVYKQSFFTILPQHSSVTLLRLPGLHNSSAILATLKNFDWYWHWQKFLCSWLQIVERSSTEEHSSESQKRGKTLLAPLRDRQLNLVQRWDRNDRYDHITFILAS